MNQRLLRMAVGLIFLVPIGARGDLILNPKLDSEAGTQVGYQYDPDFNDVSPRRFYLIERGSADLSLGGSAPLHLEASGRGWFDQDNELSLRSAFVSYNPSSFKLTVGFQEIGWGETFGIYIADLVNPRDFRDVLLNDLSWMRLPVLAANAQIFLDQLTLQFVATPWARSQQYFSTVDQLTVEPSSVSGSEYGMHASYLFGSGVDLGVIYYHHFNRNPVFSLESAGGVPVLAPEVSPVDTFGLTMSEALGSFIFRADSVYHLNQPLQMDFSDPIEQRENQSQTILGIDDTLGEVIIGAQGHADVSASRHLYWASGRVAWTGKKSGSIRPDAEVFIFRGLNNDDLWIEPRLTWALTDSLVAGVQADVVQSADSVTEGILFPVRDRGRVLFAASYKF